MPKYVQHISGQGNKWRLIAECNAGWRVEDPQNKGSWYLLPGRDYVLCAPPEPTWKDVTKECTIDSVGTISHQNRCTTPGNGYRRRLVQLAVGDPFFRFTNVIVIEQAVYEE